MIPTLTAAAMADDYSRPMSVGPQHPGDLPDLQLPEPGTRLGAVSVRASAELDLAGLITTLKDAGADIVAINTFPATRGEPNVARVFDIETRNFDSAAAARVLRKVPGVVKAEPRKTLGQIFGKRVIVIGGGAQVAQVNLGAVTEADRHNLRGERISVDTIALVGEKQIADAVRAVADLPRAHILVLAGSIMGGEITAAARELREQGIPIISLNQVGSITEVADLVVSDPVQAGVMAVMAVADTAKFDLMRQLKRRY
jgi:energy-converting hydrogenase B subunit Q